MQLADLTLWPIVGILILSVGCSAPLGTSTSAIGQELVAMMELDQRFNQMVVDGEAESREPGFKKQMQDMYEANTSRIQKIFEEVGYPSPALVGREASDAFWLLVQHSDQAPEFQDDVLNAMKPMVLAGQVSSDSLALLTDRVRVNTGRPQVYGTQVEYEMEIGKAKPKWLEEPQMVDHRRAEIDLRPLWEYMNEMCEFHFTMNLTYYTDLGVMEWIGIPSGQFQERRGEARWSAGASMGRIVGNWQPNGASGEGISGAVAAKRAGFCIGAMRQ
ncbi:MAG: hypothetical protein GY930_11275 [bacterium]|nr:hypothetical protein [bacterium]